jgi:hypothetical protein
MKRLIEATEHPLKDGLEAAQGALGSGADVARLREKLGGLPLPPPTPDGTSTSANTDTSLATTKLLHRVAKLGLTGTVIGTALIAVLTLRERHPTQATQALPTRQAVYAVQTQATPAATPAATPTAAVGAPASATESGASELPALGSEPSDPLPPEPPKPRVGVRPPSSGARASATSQAQAPGPSAANELKLLQSAQDAIDQSPRRALALLDEHTRAYSAGNFVQERESLAIEALRKLGHKTQAIARARAFVSRFPKASNTKHLQAWLEEMRAADHKIEPERLPTP